MEVQENLKAAVANIFPRPFDSVPMAGALRVPLMGRLGPGLVDDGSGGGRRVCCRQRERHAAGPVAQLRAKAACRGTSPAGTVHCPTCQGSPRVRRLTPDFGKALGLEPLWDDKVRWGCRWAAWGF